MARETKLPAIPNSVDPAVKALKEATEVRLGRRGDPLDRGVTVRDLYEGGVVKIKGMPEISLRNPGGAGTIIPKAIEGDLTTPPPPTTFTASAGGPAIALHWDQPLRTDLRTHIYRNTVDDRSTAVVIGMSVGNYYADTVGHGYTYYYWVHYVSINQVSGPFNAVAGTVGITSEKVSDIIARLSDELNQSHLAGVLSTKIDAIQINGNNITAEVSDRIAAISGEAATRLADINAEILARTTGDGTLQGNIDTVSATVTTQGTNITGTANAVGALVIRVTDNEGDISTSATDITALETTVNNPTTGVAATASGLSTLETAVTTQGTATTTNASDITALETTVNNPTTGVAASASGVSNLSTTVSTQGENISTNATDITALESTVNNPTSGVAASASGLSNLSTTVSNQADAITATAEDVTALESTINNPTTGVAASASGLSNLSTTVSNQAGTITATAEDVTDLSTTVGDHSASILSHTASIDGVSGEQYVKIDLGANAVSGYGLAANAGGSEFAVLADVFKIAHSDGSKIVPFFVQDGATYINNAMINMATINWADITELNAHLVTVTGPMVADTIDAKLLDGDTIIGRVSITAPTITGGAIHSATINSSTITGGVINGVLVLAGAVALVTEYGTPHYAYDSGVYFDFTSSASVNGNHLLGVSGNIKPYNYHLYAHSSSTVKNPASNLFRYRKQSITPEMHCHVQYNQVGGLINANTIPLQTHFWVRVGIRTSAGTILTHSDFAITSFYDGPQSGMRNRQVVQTDSSGIYQYTLNYQFHSSQGSDGWTTYNYHMLGSQTLSIYAAHIGGSTGLNYNESTSTKCEAFVQVFNYNNANTNIGTKSIRMYDVADNTG